MSRTERVDPRDTGKFRRPQIRKVVAPGIRQFEKGVEPTALSVEGSGSTGSTLRAPISQIPRIREQIAYALYSTALELAQSTKGFTPQMDKAALDVIKPWKTGKFIGLRRIKALESGQVAPSIREITAVYSAIGEIKTDASLLAYMLRILLHATKVENREIARAAKDCIDSLSQQPPCTV